MKHRFITFALVTLGFTNPALANVCAGSILAGDSPVTSSALGGTRGMRSFISELNAAIPSFSHLITRSTTRTSEKATPFRAQANSFHLEFPAVRSASQTEAGVESAIEFHPLVLSVSPDSMSDTNWRAERLENGFLRFTRTLKLPATNRRSGVRTDQILARVLEGKLSRFEVRRTQKSPYSGRTTVVEYMATPVVRSAITSLPISQETGVQSNVVSISIGEDAQSAVAELLHSRQLSISKGLIDWRYRIAQSFHISGALISTLKYELIYARGDSDLVGYDKKVQVFYVVHVGNKQVAIYQDDQLVVGNDEWRR